MHLQPIVLTLAIGALAWPIAPASAAQGGGGHAASGHAASGRATSGRTNAPTRASRGGVRNPRGAMRRTIPRSMNGTAQTPPTPGMPLPNPVVVGSAALIGPAPGGDIFRARPNTYGGHPRSRLAIGAGFGGGPWFSGNDVEEPMAPDDVTTAVAAASAPAGPATVIAAGPPETDAHDDLHRHGEIRFDVQPLAAQVFVDGELRGTIADFYHSLLGLSLAAGRHHLELRASGYQTVSADVTVIAGRTVGYGLTMTRTK